MMAETNTLPGPRHPMHAFERKEAIKFHLNASFRPALRLPAHNLSRSAKQSPSPVKIQAVDQRADATDTQWVRPHSILTKEDIP